VNRTAAQLGMPAGTLEPGQGDNHPETAELWRTQKEDLAAELREIAFKCARILPGKLDQANASQVAVVMGIAVDKMLLLLGSRTRSPPGGDVRR
jgi:hypothetical protein